MVLFIVILEADSWRETRMFFRISPFVLKTGIYDNIFILNELFIHGFQLNIMKIIVFLFSTDPWSLMEFLMPSDKQLFFTQYFSYKSVIS